MLRIAHYRPRTSMTGGQMVEATQAAIATCRALKKVEGFTSVRLYFNRGDYVIVSQMDGYAAFDRALADPDVQATFRKLFVDFALFEASTEDLVEPEQLAPFVQG